MSSKRRLLACLHFSYTSWCEECGDYMEYVELEPPKGKWWVACENDDCTFQRCTGQSEGMARFYSLHHPHPVKVEYRIEGTRHCGDNTAVGGMVSRISDTQQTIDGVSESESR